VTILDFETREGQDRVSVALRGELDLSCADKVERELQRVEATGPSVVVLDLSGLAFLDSTGLRLIVNADQRARESGRRLAIVKGPVAVHRVFSITKLDERLDMVDSVDDLREEA